MFKCLSFLPDLKVISGQLSEARLVAIFLSLQVSNKHLQSVIVNTLFTSRLLSTFLFPYNKYLMDTLDLSKQMEAGVA